MFRDREVRRYSALAENQPVYQSSAIIHDAVTRRVTIGAARRIWGVQV
jgi:hypothetical protein